MLPVGIVIATIAMMSGVGGAIFFSPFFMLVLKLDPLLALGSSLAIEVFGFTSGVIGYTLKKSVNFRLIRGLAWLTVPATVGGVFLGRLFPVVMLKLILALLLLFLAWQFLLKDKKCIPKDPRCTGIDPGNPGDKDVSITPGLRSVCLFGGLLMGMISSGLGEVNEYVFLKKLRISVPVASGTSVFLVALSAIVGVVSHAYFLLSHGGMEVFGEVASIVLFAVPGVVLGAQIGVRVVRHINEQAMGKFMGSIFLLLGVLTMAIAFK